MNIANELTANKYLIIRAGLILFCICGLSLVNDKIKMERK